MSFTSQICVPLFLFVVLGNQKRMTVGCLPAAGCIAGVLLKFVAWCRSWNGTHSDSLIISKMCFLLWKGARVEMGPLFFFRVRPPVCRENHHTDFREIHFTWRLLCVFMKITGITLNIFFLVINFGQQKLQIEINHKFYVQDIFDKSFLKVILLNGSFCSLNLSVWHNTD
jgi:hypothetical protein